MNNNLIKYTIFLFRVPLLVYLIFGRCNLYFLYLTWYIKNSYKIIIDNLKIIINDLIDLFKTVMKLFKKRQLNILIFILVFVTKLLNIKD